jgi:hypothetical protein
MARVHKPFTERELEILAKSDVNIRATSNTRHRLRHTITQNPELAEWASILLKKYSQPKTEKLKPPKGTLC